MENIIILVFASGLYNLDELKSMSPADRIELAQFERGFGYDNADVLTPSAYQDLFNSGVICPESCYIFFEEKQ